MSTENALFHKNAYVGWTHTNGNYYPPDFDPKAIVPNKKHAEKQKKLGADKFMSMNMRMMMPFSMNCNTCGEFMYIGTKFNSRMQKVEEDTYLNLSVYRFFGFCKHCRAEFTFKTNPKDGNYIMESGGSRQYEAFADAAAVEQDMKTEEQRAAEDAMAALEQKRIDTKREEQAHNDLDRIMAMNKRAHKDMNKINAALDALFGEGKIGAQTSEALFDAGLELMDPRQAEIEDQELEDECAAFLQMQKAARAEVVAGSSGAAGPGPELDDVIAGVATESQAAGQEVAPKSAMEVAFEMGQSEKKQERKRPAALIGAVIKKKKKVVVEAEKVPEKPKAVSPKAAAGVGLGGLMGSYGSSSSEED